jgi:hypothetical protein
VKIPLRNNSLDLQRAFFPPSFQNAEQFVPRKPGEERAFPFFRILVEVDNDFLIQVPFREASKVSAEFINEISQYKPSPARLELAMGWQICTSSNWTQTDASDDKYEMRQRICVTLQSTNACRCEWISCDSRRASACCILDFIHQRHTFPDGNRYSGKFL